jgi:hypothetical protein
MTEIRTVTTLRSKRDEIAASVRLYERQLEQAKADLQHVLAAIRIFEASGDPNDATRYMDVHRLFRRGETWAICREALATKGPMTTKELVTVLMKARKLPDGDRVMNRALGQKLVNSLGKQELRGKLLRDGKRKGVVIWRLPAEKTLV